MKRLLEDEGTAPGEFGAVLEAAARLLSPRREDEVGLLHVGPRLTALVESVGALENGVHDGNGILADWVSNWLTHFQTLDHGSEQDQSTIEYYIALRHMSVLLNHLITATAGLAAQSPEVQFWVAQLQTLILNVCSASELTPSVRQLLQPVMIETACHGLLTLSAVVTATPTPSAKRAKLVDKAAMVVHLGKIALEGLSLPQTQLFVVQTFTKLLTDAVYQDAALIQGIKNHMAKAVNACYQQYVLEGEKMDAEAIPLFLAAASWKGFNLASGGEYDESQLPNLVQVCFNVVENMARELTSVPVEMVDNLDDYLSRLTNTMNVLNVGLQYATDSSGKEGRSLTTGLRNLSLDLTQYSLALTALTLAAKRYPELYALVLNHLKYVMEVLTPADVGGLADRIANLVQELFLDNHDGESLLKLLVEHPQAFPAFRCFVDSVTLHHPSIWTVAMLPFGNDLTSGGAGGIGLLSGMVQPVMSQEKNVVRLGFRLKHRLISVLKNAASLVCNQKSLRCGHKQLWSLVNDLVVSITTIHLALGGYASISEVETDVVAVCWWLYNGLNAKLAAAGLGYTPRGLAGARRSMDSYQIGQAVSSLNRLRQFLSVQHHELLRNLLFALGVLTGALTHDLARLILVPSTPAVSVHKQDKNARKFVHSAIILCRLWESEVRLQADTTEVKALLTRLKVGLSSMLSASDDLSSILRNTEALRQWFETNEEGSADLSEEVPADLSEEGPADLSEEMPVDLSEEVPADLSKDMPVDRSDSRSDDSQEEASEDLLAHNQEVESEEDQDITLLEEREGFLL